MAVAVEHMRNLGRGPSRASWKEIAEWYERYRDLVRGYLSQRTRSASDAEDIVQEAFLHLWFARSSGPIHNPKAFLFTTASNLLTDQSRRAHIRATQTAVHIEDVDIPDVASEPSRAVEAEQALTQIVSILRQLRLPTRKVFLLDRLQSCSHADIAARVGVSVSMVEKHMNYAMTALEESGFEQPRHFFGRRARSPRNGRRPS